MAALIACGLFAASAQSASKEREKAPKESPKEPSKLAEDLHETIVKLPVTVRLVSGKQHTGKIVLTYYRPAGDGPFPIAIVNHGRSGQKEERAATPRFRETLLAQYFVRRGFAVFVPTRLGYGDSGVEIDPDAPLGSCSDPDYRPGLQVMLAQTIATANFAKSLPWADGRRLIIAGQSYGGFAAVAASANNQLGALAAINFVGGGGGLWKKPGQPCGPASIAAAMAEAGKQAKVPMLWLYAENDSLWGGELPRKWHAAYLKAGGKAQMLMLPPVPENGHYLARTAFQQWRPVADQFLEAFGFPPPRSADAPAATDFARLDEVDKLPFTKTGKEGYQKFLRADLPRAFAVSTRGAWASRSGENAIERALQACREYSVGTCHLYAVDDAVVFKMPESAEASPAP
ncbi:MAG: hypothetical protein QOD94_1679 [Alphaproteobacteria bacterium]|jgi:dienelactone hydrolase|nr:hypothetical protein [Alphaproteobacteria bacterium]